VSEDAILRHLFEGGANHHRGGRRAHRPGHPLHAHASPRPPPNGTMKHIVR
jgi:hypothetical protein